MASAIVSISGQIRGEVEIAVAKESGNEYIKFSIPVNTRAKDPRKDGELSNWYRIVVTGYRAKGLITLARSNRLQSGTFVAVHGEQTVTPYARRDGSGWDFSIDVNAHDVDVSFGGDTGGSAPPTQNSANRWAASGVAPAEAETPEDIPF